MKRNDQKIDKWDIIVSAFSAVYLIAAAMLITPVKWIFYFAVTVLMAYVCYTDIHYRKIRTKGMYVLILLGIISIWIYPISLIERFSAVIIVGGSLITTVLITNKIFGTTKSIGGGDFRILVYSGLMFGYWQLYVIGIASFMTLIFSAASVIVHGRKLRDIPGYRICLGPFMAFAIISVLLWLLAM